MWYLKSERNGSLFYLLAGKTYTVSRKVGDLVLADDQSVSRNHSGILISNEGEVFLWDKESKYGTFMYEGDNFQKLKPQKRTKIKIGDKLRFGLQWNVYVLCKMNFVVCTSSITGKEKELLRSLLPKIGGSFSNDWNDNCTHLAMNQVSLTHKVVLSLAAGKPITTVQYWREMVEAISNQQTLPKIGDYLPPVGEEELQRQTSPDTLLPSENRKLLFKGKVFIFSSESSKSKIQPLVECGGGVCRSVQTLKQAHKVCCEPNYIVIKESEACKHSMPDVFAALKLRALRAIPVSEIGLAIYNGSLSRYCNPSWRKPVILGGPPTQSQGVCLVQNTEDIPLNTQDIKFEPQEIIVIPPSFGSVVSDTSIDSSRSVKRPLSTSPADKPPPKRLVQQKDTAKASGTLHQWIQRSGTSSTKETQETCSFDVSRDDLFGTRSQTTNGDDKATHKSSRNETDLFKKPSPKKSIGVKRGRTDDFDVNEDDTFGIPSPKKASTSAQVNKTSKLPSPIKVVNREDDKLEEMIENDSDDEFQLPSRRKASPPVIEDDDDEFKLPSSSRKRSIRVPSVTLSATATKTNWPQEDELSHDLSLETRKTGFVAPTKAVSRVEARTTESRVQARTTDLKPVTRIETSTISVTDSTNSNGQGNISHAPSLAEFLDKSDGIHIKKEKEEGDDEMDQVISKINFEITEMSLYRTRPPLRDLSTNPISDGRPNFKKFRKITRRCDRSRIDLIVDADISMFEGVPDADDPIPNGSPNHRVEVTPSQDIFSVFPSTNGREGTSRQNRERRVPDNDIVDDWTIP